MIFGAPGPQGQNSDCFVRARARVCVCVCFCVCVCVCVFAFAFCFAFWMPSPALCQDLLVLNIFWKTNTYCGLRQEDGLFKMAPAH